MKILVIQLKRIGDLILTTPAIARIKEQFPEAHITLVADSGCVNLLPAIDEVDAFHVIQRHRSNGRVFRKLRRHTFDYCIDFTGTDRSAILTFATRAKKRATFQWIERKGIRRFAYNCKITSSIRHRHTIDHYLDLVNGTLGLPSDERRPEKIPHGLLTIPDKVQKSTAALLAKHQLQPGGYFIIHAGAARPEKLWLRDRWPLIAEDAAERTGLTPVFTGGHSDPESIHTNAILDNLPDTVKVVNLVAKTDILTTAEIVRQSAFVLGVDTSIIHLAGVFQRPHLVLFGPTNPYHWRVRGAGATVMMAGKDQPSTEFLPDHNRLNMSSIKTEDVLKATRKVIDDAREMGTIAPGYTVP